MSITYPFDDIDHPNHSPWAVATVFLCFLLTVALVACTGKLDMPPPAPPVQAVYIPVTEKCDVAQVESSTLHTDDGAPDDIYDATKQLLADIGLLKADREKLQAANKEPCE